MKMNEHHENDKMSTAGPENPASGQVESREQKPKSDAPQKMSGESMSGMGGQHASMPGMSGMSTAGHDEAMWRDSLWASFVNVVLGAWLLTSPPTLGYDGSAAANDYISGAVIIVLALAVFFKRLSSYARWAVCFVGIWLLFAPLVFWTASPADYLNDTLTGALVIAFAVLVTMMPGMDMSVMEGADVPAGWSYNPSSWLQRAPIILLALIGFLASRYMAAFQLGHIPDIYDPFFGEGTRRVLSSDVSKMFPISDAGLGSLSYMIEILMGFMGDKARWRTMPWMVMFFGILVVPLGTVSVVLIILQPLAVGAWCSPCLLAGVAMLAMIPATLDEVVAMLQFMVQAKRDGKPMWRTFWLGGTAEGAKDDELTPFGWSNPISSMLLPWLSGIWNLLAVAGIGVWLMFAPFVFRTTGRAADSDHLVGALIVTFAVISIAEVGRAARYINVLFGAWLVLAPFALAGFTTGATASSIIAGVAVIALTLRRGRIGTTYGEWQPYIF